MHSLKDQEKEILDDAWVRPKHQSQGVSVRGTALFPRFLVDSWVRPKNQSQGPRAWGPSSLFVSECQRMHLLNDREKEILVDAWVRPKESEPGTPCMGPLQSFVSSQLT